MAGLKLPVGTIVSGRYQVGELIGESELSAVHSATDLRGSAHVALKVFDPAVRARAAALSEYQAQARQASGLGVEGIARAYDFGIDANSGAPFSTAERIGWPSLERRVLAEGPLGVVELARALTVLGRALDAAHATGLVHRDLKPQNVFISPDNPEWARITDFGIGALRRGSPEAMGWGGPPGYTPPDAVDAASPAPPFADLFALGVLAFFALTRGTPFRSLRGQAFDPSAHWAELNQPLFPISERARELGVALDPSLDPWFSRALSLSAEARFPNASEMARELVAASEQLGHRGAGPRSIPGIAVAIAQPLVFQPEPSPASLGLAPATASPAANVTPQDVARTNVPVVAPTLDGSPPRKKSLALPLMLGGGVVLLSGLALGSYAMLSGRGAPPASSAAPDATPESTVAAPSVATATPSASAAPVAAEPAPSPLPSATPSPSHPAATAEAATPPAPKAAPPPAAKPTASVATKPATAATAKTATAKPAATSTSKPAASALAKAASTPAGAASAKVSGGAAKSAKKKCSTFLGCK